MVLIRTFRPTNWINPPTRPEENLEPQTDGFTLIEVLIVVFIIALVSVLILPSVTSYFQLSLSATGREMSSTIKEAYNSSVITGRVYRMVYDFKAESYWVESAPAGVLLDTKESKEKEERRKRYASINEAPPPSAFSMDKLITRNKVSLPTGVVFEDIITQQSKDPITEGLAYTHFFPHGPTEQTIIHIKDNSNHKASLVITALIGHTDLYERNVSASDIFGK
jgi:prepilin-type N-terminal cleavage/methylation domain-containing protein